MIILVRDECPYVQFRAARVTSTEFVVGGYKLAREKELPSLCGSIARCFYCSIYRSIDLSLSLNDALPFFL